MDVLQTEHGEASVASVSEIQTGEHFFHGKIILCVALLQNVCVGIFMCPLVFLHITNFSVNIPMNER